MSQQLWPGRHGRASRLIVLHQLQESVRKLALFQTQRPRNLLRGPTRQTTRDSGAQPCDLDSTTLAALGIVNASL
jgi:hypothetical protein